MAFVRERARVRFYDDSKGTNVGASVTAVRGVREEKVVLIAGGRDKGGSYEPLAAALRERGRGVVLIGESKQLIEGALGGAVPVRMAESMEEAVAFAAELARPGDAVLLSPACSSFDMFRDYKHRGDVFVQAVMELPS
jgi:UDP-N-acetylmuramoylalanine--D-glutamate ligase